MNIKEENKKNEIDRKNELLILCFNSSILLSGFLIPFNILFYSRYLFERAHFLDLIIFAAIFLIFLIMNSKLSEISGILIGWILQVVSNIFLGLFLSLSATDINPGAVISFNLFGNLLTLWCAGIPLIIYLFSGFLIFSKGLSQLTILKMDFNGNTLRDDDLSSELTISDEVTFWKFKIAIISFGIACGINAFIRSIGGDYTTNLFILAPLSGIIGIYILIFLKQKKLLTNETSIAELRNADKDNQNEILRIIKIILKTVIFLTIIIIALLEIGVSGLEIISQIKHELIQSVFNSIIALCMMWTLVIFITITLIHEISKKRGKPQLFKHSLNSLLVVIIVSATIVVWNQFINAFKPEAEFDLVLQLFSSSYIIASYSIFIFYLILQKTSVPHILAFFSALLLSLSMYIVRIPLKGGEMWNQYGLYSMLFIIFMLIMIVFTIFAVSRFLDPDKKENTILGRT